MHALLAGRKFWVWVGIWVVTRLLILGQVGFWNDEAGVQLEDVALYAAWVEEHLALGALPGEEAWQYPPGAAFLLLLPDAGWSDYGDWFVATMLAFDFAGLLLLALLGRREGNDTGVWVWLLAMPMLRALPVLRFDLVPTVIAIAALLVIHRRPAWFGVLAGIGAAIKVWPVVVLFGEWDRRRLLYGCLAALAALAYVFAVSAFAFDGSQLGFLTEQNGRGLQVEAVASLPWHVEHFFSGEAPPNALRYGAWEIADGAADTVADLLKWAALAAAAAAGAWWLARTRAIRDGRERLGSAVVSRDFVFAVVLLLAVTSRVLSPQYMVWLLGLAAVVLAARESRLRRPAWIVVGAAVLTTGAYGFAGAYTGSFDVYGSPFNMIARNVALLVAAIDAVIAMVVLLRRPAADP
jgi:hypothetical protein